MNRQDSLDALDFNDDGVCHAKVEPIRAVNGQPLIDERQDNLALYREPHRREFMAEAFLVRALEQAWTERRVYSDCATDNGLCDGIYFHVSVLSVCSVVRISGVGL